MPDSPIALGVDFGTSHTAAVLVMPDGRQRQLLFDGGPQLLSAVFLDESGLLTGQDAVFAGQQRPERLELFPKQRIDDGAVLLGDAEVPVQDLIAAVLQRVADEAVRNAGRPASQVVLTVPADWGPRRREIFSAAARIFGGHRLITEPVAAALRFLAVTGTSGRVAVYDLGAGTCDAAVVHAGAGGGAEVVAAAGLSGAGGLDIDAAIVASLGAALEHRNPEAWRRLTTPQTAADRRARAQLWNSVRQAKEMLSRAATAHIPIPLFDDAVPFGREQLDQIARPVLDRTVTLMRTVLRDAGTDPADLSALYLVGGASRTPLAAHLLHRAFGIAPIVLEQPELVVAEGAALAAATTATITEHWPTRPPVPTGTPRHPTPARRGRVFGLAAATAAAAAVALAAWIAINTGDGDGGELDATGTRTPVVSASSSGTSPARSPAAVAATVDPCLVGSWAITSLEIRGVRFNGRTMTLRGGGTAQSAYSFNADGTGALRPGSLIATGSAGGDSYRVEFKGVTSWTYEARNGKVTYHSRLGNVLTLATRDGESISSDEGGPLKADTDSYECAGDSARVFGSDFDAKLRRKT
jgi:molecular chaperone DnaK